MCKIHIVKLRKRRARSTLTKDRKRSEILGWLTFNTFWASVFIPVEHHCNCQVEVFYSPFSVSSLLVMIIALQSLLSQFFAASIRVILSSSWYINHVSSSDTRATGDPSEDLCLSSSDHVQASRYHNAACTELGSRIGPYEYTGDSQDHLLATKTEVYQSTRPWLLLIILFHE